MHVNCCVCIKWKIGGLKEKWHKLMKHFNYATPMFYQFLKFAPWWQFVSNVARTVLIFFTCECGMNDDPHGWDGDYYCILIIFVII